MNLKEHTRTPILFHQWREATEGSLKEKEAYYKLVQHTYRGTRFCDEKLQSAHHDLINGGLNGASRKLKKSLHA
tara:strand:- start:81 stop:302 length:222 start_codon:yes stop_codon:yes gene_type:complete